MMSWPRGVSRSVQSLLSLGLVPALAAAQTRADGVSERLAKLGGAAGD